MANFEDGSYNSAAGIALIAKVLAGRCQMKYTRVAAGKGTIPEGETPKTMTEPAGYVMDAKIASVTNPENGECQVTVQINSSDVEQGFFCTALLLYAEDPDEGEVPYTYLVLENEPEWIRPSSSAVGKLATFDLVAAVGDVDVVKAAIDPDAIMSYEAVRNLIKEHNEDAEAHEDIRALANSAKEEAETAKDTVSGLVVISAAPPESGPALWLCDGPYRPEPDEVVTTLRLGGEEDVSAALVFTKIDGTDYPVKNADGESVGEEEYRVTIKN